MAPRNFPRPISVRGIIYPDSKAAAQACNVSVAAVQCARRRGKLDQLGLSTARPVAHRNTHYDSIREAEIATGHSHEWIKRRAARFLHGWRFLPTPPEPETVHVYHP